MITSMDRRTDRAASHGPCSLASRTISAACAHAMSVTRNPEPVHCDLGSPLRPDDVSTTVSGAIDMAMFVQDNQAVALTFAGHTRLSESRKIALLCQAATLADR